MTARPTLPVTRRRLALIVVTLGLAALLAVLFVPRRSWRHVRDDPARGQALVSACRGLMATIAPGVSLSWGYGAWSDAGVALPEEVAGLSPFWVVADRHQVQLGWPEGRATPTLYRGLIVYAEGAEPGTSSGETGHGHFRREKLSDALWTFESQGDQ